MTSLINPVVTLDGSVYAVHQNTYVRRWTRAFSSNLAANIIRLNFVDRGPGIRVYSFQLNIMNWASTSLPYKAGATVNFDAQRTAIEASYSKIGTPLQFLDIFGEPPTLAGSAASAISNVATTIQITSALAALLKTPPNATQTYPYNMYIWAVGTSLGAGLAAGSGVETVSVTGLSGTTLSVTRGSPQSWLSGANLAVPIGVYLTNFNQVEVADMTSLNPRIIAEIELTEATQVVA